MSNYYIFPVGDWSGDGHAFVAEFLVKGSKPLQEVRETQFLYPWIGKLCEEYGENTVFMNIADDTPDPQATTQFLMKLVEKYQLEITSDEDDKEIVMTPESLMDLWAFLLNQFNPELELEVVSEALSKWNVKYKGYPVDTSLIEGYVNFYGFDDKGRHLDTPGYGVWDDSSSNEFYLDCN